MIRKSTHYLVRPCCVILAMGVLSAVVWDYKHPENVGNLFVCLILTWQIMTTFVTWMTMRTFENNTRK